MNTVHSHLNYSLVFTALHQAAQMYEEAGAIEAAQDIRREEEKLARMTNTVLSPEILEDAESRRESNPLFDIPSFLNEAVRNPPPHQSLKTTTDASRQNWFDSFPELNVYSLD